MMFSKAHCVNAMVRLLPKTELLNEEIFDTLVSIGIQTCPPIGAQK